MDNFEREEMERDRRRLVIMGLVIVALVLVVVIGSIIVIVSSGGDKENDKLTSEGDSGFSLGNQMFHEDIYRGKILIPKYDAPANEYDINKFNNINGMISYDDPNAVIGIDVSNHQGAINWEQVKASGVDFVMLRAGYRGFTEGKLNTDDTFVYNIENAIANGLKVGVYFFSSAITEDEAREEAKYIINLIKDYDITYPVAFDWEYQNVDANARTSTCTGEDVSNFTRAFCDVVKAEGYKPMYYTNKTMGYDTFDLGALKDIDMWYAEYQPKPSFYYHFDMWQYTDSGTISGVPTSVDVNICFKKYD